MEKLNLPNILTIFRLIAGPIIFILILFSKNYTALILFIAALISDLIDGYMARKKQIKTRFGEILDPLADKLLFGWALFAVLIKYKLLLWILIFSFFIILYTLGYIFFVKNKKKVDMVGRIITVLQALVIISLLIGFVNNLILIIFLILCLIRIVYYILYEAK